MNTSPLKNKTSKSKSVFAVFLSHLISFLEFFLYYTKRKIFGFSHSFERNKNKLVKFFMMKRGRYNRPFLHLTTMGVLFIGVLIAPYLADTYPIFASNASTIADLNDASNKEQSIIVGTDVFQTIRSDRPRDGIITYTVEKGDTISTIAKKFGISTDTIKWENDLTSDDVTVGDQLRILPVTGISHKVESGETIYTIAKKFATDPQKIVDFPSNDFANPETFSLVTGEILIVPDGVEPSEQSTSQPQTPHVFVAQPVPVSGGKFVFPLPNNTGISQYASWYHMALDITAPFGTPIYAAENGTVTYVSVGTYDTGYGNNVWVSNGSGIDTHYAHMKAVNVSAGQQVVAGQTVIGWVGLTGRTTGPHLHFEVRQNGVLVNPLGYVQ